MIDLINHILTHPATIATAYPTLLLTAITSTLEWHRLGQDDDAFTIDDYTPPPATGRAPVRHLRPIDAPTQPATDVLPAAPPGADAGSPLYYQLRARQILTEAARTARTSSGSTS